MIENLGGWLIYVWGAIVILIPVLVWAVCQGRNQNLKPPEE